MKFIKIKDGAKELILSLIGSLGNVTIDNLNVNLKEGGSVSVYDHRGFLLFEVDEATGDIRHKGAFIKI